MKKLNLVRTTILAGSLLLQLSTLCFHLRGAPGDVDLSFDPGSGVNGTVNAVLVQSDGKVIIGGDFTTVRGLARHSIARLNADGSGDPAFNPATFNPGRAYEAVSALALQSDGKVLVVSLYPDYFCDEFGCYDFTAFRVTRLNTNGSLDSSFFASTNWNADSIAVQSDGKVLLGGLIETLNGTNRNYGIVRLNSNGSLDTGFNSGTNAADVVNPVVVQPDGKVLIGIGGIARLNANGTLDTSFNKTEVNGYVISIALQSDGKVLLGGGFDTVNGANRHGIARLNANGSLDNSFNPGAGANDWVRSIALQSDGQVLIGGYFTTINGTNRNSIARLNANGSLDSSFDPGTGAGGNPNRVESVAVQSDGKVLIGGSFAAFNGTNRANLARLNADGGLDGSFNPGRDLEIPASLVVQPDGKVLVGGPLTFINGTNRYGSARLNADGSADDTFISDSFNPDVGISYPTYTALAVQPDGKVLLGGVSYFYDCNDVSCIIYDGYFVARVNAKGSRDTDFEPALGPMLSGGGERVRALAVQPDGKVVVGGTFNSIKGTNRLGLARLNANGSLDGSFNPGPGMYGWYVESVALQPDGKVLVAEGYFIRRLNSNGSLDGSFGTAVGGFGKVESMVVQSDGKVLIGGNFATINGTSRNNIARLNTNGGLDSSFNPSTGADGWVRSIALQSDGKVLIGGDFSTVNGVVRPRVARLYGDSAPSLNIGRSNALVILSWPVTGLNFQLQESTNLALPNSWSSVAQSAATNGNQVTVTVPVTTGRKFFRLQAQ
jgi:uncharacterized delta-60 repeat protein